MTACLWIPAPVYGQGDQPAPFADGWSVQHHDRHNADWIPLQFRDFTPTNQMRQINWLLREADNPTVEVGGVTVVGSGTNTIIYATTGKVFNPNLWALRMEDGSLYWATPSSTNETDPGPDSCVLSMPPALDKSGNLYLADCHYVYSYRATPDLNADGNQKYKWRRQMPNLRMFDYEAGRWYRTNDPGTNVNFARPFLSFQFTPYLNGTSYVAGITVDGEVYVFNPSNGDLFAETYLETNVLSMIDTNEPCEPCQFAIEDDPMKYSDGKILLGIWCTGSDTDDPDLDYFMNPCQLEALLQAGTLGIGTMIANNLCVAPDPVRTNVARLFICGSPSERLKAMPVNSDDDGFIYRIDFDPTQDYSNRLVIMNYVMTNRPIIGLEPVFKGRMPHGEGSATSPDLSLNEQWLLCGDNGTNFYCFSTEDGHASWTQGIGKALGSPTTFQNPDTNGCFLEVSFGDYDPWFMLIDQDTGQLATNPATGDPYIRQVRFSEVLTNDYWRSDDPRYLEEFTNVLGQSFTRIAIGASVIVGTSNKVVMVYTVGWHNPLDPTGYLFTVPSHSVVIVADLEDIWTATNIADLIDAAYMDTNGTSEVGLIPSPDGHNRALTICGSQSATMAQFLDVNDLMPTNMKPLYVRPYGGFNIVELPFLDVASVPPPEVVGVTRTGSESMVRWTASTGIHYAVESQNNLHEEPWTEVYQHKAMTPTQSAVDVESGSATTRFYRVRVLP